MKVPFTAELIASLTFDHRPVGTNPHGRLVFDEKKTPAAVKDWTLRDATLPGFGIRLTRGSKSFFVQRKRGSSTSDRYVLTDQHSLRAARAQAQAWLGRMARGEDPREERDQANAARLLKRAREAMTFGKVFEAYAAGGVNLRPSTTADRKLACRWLASERIWDVPLYALSKADVHATFGPMMTAAIEAKRKRKADAPRKRGGGPRADVASAWKALRHCTAAWTATEADKAPANPFAAWRREHRKTLPRVERRETVLPLHTDAGVKWLRKLLDLRADATHSIAVVADYLVCVVLWGGRRAEIQKLRWADVDERAGTLKFRAETTKTRRDLWLPLTEWAAGILRERRQKNAGFGFSTDNDAWVFPSTVEGAHVVELRDVQALLQEASGLWIGPHDLRRTLASDVFGDTKNVRTVGLALGHAASDGDVSAGYVPDAERLRALRPLYEQREQRLKALAGMKTAAPKMTREQRAIAKGVEDMLRGAGISLAEIGKRWANRT
jgi:integrase